jgi:hypothetical protein
MVWDGLHWKNTPLSIRAVQSQYGMHHPYLPPAYRGGVEREEDRCMFHCTRYDTLYVIVVKKG